MTPHFMSNEGRRVYRDVFGRDDLAEPDLSDGEVARQTRRAIGKFPDSATPEKMMCLDAAQRLECVAPVRLLAVFPSEECGCPEELWAIGEERVIIHLEEDGGGEIHYPAADGDVETIYVPGAKMMGDLRSEMFRRFS